MGKGRFRSTKVIDGFSACFKQRLAKMTHCELLHGYSIDFQIVMEGELDERNWITDFGFVKRSKTKIPVKTKNGLIEMSLDEWFKYYFDHVVVLSENDPHLEYFKKGDELGAFNLRILPEVGCEMFAKFVFDTLKDFFQKEVGDRVRVVSVECREHAKNTALYLED